MNTEQSKIKGMSLETNGNLQGKKYELAIDYPQQVYNIPRAHNKLTELMEDVRDSKPEIWPRKFLNEGTRK